jgi:Fe-Mn family superoxide dismutase
MNRRSFIALGVINVVGLSAANLKANSILNNTTQTFSPPKLPYTVSDVALNGLFSTNGFNRHFNEHLIKSGNRFNLLVDKLAFRPKYIRDIIERENNYKSALVQSSLSYYNHKVFFKQIYPQKMSGSSNTLVKKQIKQDFGSLMNLKEELIEKSEKLHTNGWIWLINSDSGLKVCTTTGNDNPLLGNIGSHAKGFPVIAIDLWDESYKIDYNNNKEGYLSNLFECLNWNYIDKRYMNSLHYKSS